MKYTEYKQLNPFERFGYNIKNFFTNLPRTLSNFFKKVFDLIISFFTAIVKGIANFALRFIKGDWATKISYLIMGFGNAVRGQIGKGIIFLAVEIAYILFLINFGIVQLSKFDNLGDLAVRKYLKSNGRWGEEYVDNSMLILLYGVLTIVLTVVFIAVYISSTKSAYKAEQDVKSGVKLKKFVYEAKEFLDSRFHTTLLSFPILTIGMFTILPLIFMILIAFTNYNKANMPPGNLFTWVGFDTFSKVFKISSAGADVSKTFFSLTQWTIVWAIIATFSNYLLGMIFALMINKKSIKLKKLWRTLFVMTIAVPQFVSLLLIRQMLQTGGGAINILLQTFGGSEVDFVGASATALMARTTVLIVNCWVGIPYTILITSGILMNIPVDLYESATIDGAGPVTSFFKITLPYMLFVTGPYLITSFIGNINNFNVIFLLTEGGPKSDALYQAGETDLLVTWLFKLTMNHQDYNLAAAIGILVFIVCATLSLITFNMTKSARNEEEFS